ncbi:ABC transporter permease [Rhodospirillaceae bacterium SYSU D60014]|uniref:ABC transporter permease n=1 Tax=Virgifigura deserti TaxID=2268457 RepID=UPI000E6763F8
MVSATDKATVDRSERSTLLSRVRGVFLRHEALRGYLLLSPTLLVMLGMMIVPLTALIILSFWTQDYFELDRTFTLANYAAIFALAEGPIDLLADPFGAFANPIYLALLLKSIEMSLSATIAVVLLAYPMAYFLAFRVTKNKLVWLILITVPFWTSYLLRVFAWKVILGYNGVINSGLMSLGLIDKPLEFLLYNPASVTITLAHAWAAFAILPIYVSLEKIDRSLLEAATDLGDGPVRRFFRVTLPLSMPGTIAATLLVFIPTVGDYVTPTLVGGTSGIMIGNIIQSLFGKANNAPLGAAVSITSMLIITLLVCAFLWLVGYGRMRRQGT